jgi:DNA gyrase subunit A
LRYLNYALSVITSRALPDVRDGLKPVQRRHPVHDVAAEPDRRRQASQVRQGSSAT